MGCLRMNCAAGQSEVSASPELCFLAYGGFFLLDSEGKVVAVQAGIGPENIQSRVDPKKPWKAVTGDTTQACLKFEEPRKWREVWTSLNTMNMFGGRFD